MRERCGKVPHRESGGAVLARALLRQRGTRRPRLWKRRREQRRTRHQPQRTHGLHLRESPAPAACKTAAVQRRLIRGWLAGGVIAAFRSAVFASGCGARCRDRCVRAASPTSALMSSIDASACRLLSFADLQRRRPRGLPRRRSRRRQGLGTSLPRRRATGKAWRTQPRRWRRRSCEPSSRGSRWRS